VASLPALVWQVARWGPFRGGWLPGYLRSHRAFDLAALPRDVPVDVIVTVVDHFEPESVRRPELAVEDVASWCSGYRRIADRHRDADGARPQHTWFYRAEYPNTGCLLVLSDETFAGYGEIEFHLHHGFDTHETFAAKLDNGLDWFNRAGAMLTAEPLPRRRFAYIAGNWALDNGAGDDAKSGCNTEIAALRDAGCYADFTYPALGCVAQPRKSNSIYYATDAPEPKSHDTGVEVAVGRPPCGDLMIFQGPLVVDWASGTFEGSALERFAPPSPHRLDAWLKGNVHVRGRPEWIFVKLHTHGMQSRGEFLGPGLDATFDAMQRRWNRGRFRLHYATAREAYNIARAAEAGHAGNPNDFRDYEIPRPANRVIRCDTTWQLLAYGPDRVSLRADGPGSVQVDFASGPIRMVRGNLRGLDARFDGGDIAWLNIDGEGGVEVDATTRVPGLEPGRRVAIEELRRLFASSPPSAAPVCGPQA
jgi:hypothetical protein